MKLRQPITRVRREHGVVTSVRECPPVVPLLQPRVSPAEVADDGRVGRRISFRVRGYALKLRP